jgi:hypothetical protein
MFAGYRDASKFFPAYDVPVCVSWPFDASSGTCRTHYVVNYPLTFFIGRPVITLTLSIIQKPPGKRATTIPPSNAAFQIRNIEVYHHDYQPIKHN